MNNLKFGENATQLSREQMKEISGGVVACTITDDNGGERYEVCNGNSDYCQGYYDAACQHDAYCSDADCGAK